jgi:hypothetical protein
MSTSIDPVERLAGIAGSIPARASWGYDVFLEREGFIMKGFIMNKYVFRIELWKEGGDESEPGSGIFVVVGHCELCARRYVLEQFHHTGRFVRLLEREEVAT